MKAVHSLAFMLASASAFKYNAQSGPGAGPYENRTHIAKKMHTPNSTVSVPFQLANQDWTFQVNITEISIPDAEGSLDDPRLTDTAYALQWPDSKGLNTTLEEAYDTDKPRLCAWYVSSPFPSNVTNGWDKGSASCESALGAECVQAIKTHYEQYTNLTVGCSAKFEKPGQLPECHGSIGTWGVSVFDLLRDHVDSSFYPDADPAALPLKNGAAFAFKTTPVYAGGGETHYDDEGDLSGNDSFARDADRLHMTVLVSDTVVPLCARVNSKEVNETDPGTAPESAAVSMKMNALSLLGSFVSVAIVLLL